MLTHSEFSKAVMRGVQRANQHAVNWSGGDVCAQDQGAEYLLTVEVGRELQKAQNRGGAKGYVLLEAKARELLRNGPSKRGRAASAIRAGGRIDVTVFDGQYRPIGLVEVKRLSADGGGLAKDAARVAAILRRMGKRANGTVRHAALATLRVVEADDISVVANRIGRRIQSALPGFRVRALTTKAKCKLIDDDRTWYSHALCFTIHEK